MSERAIGDLLNRNVIMPKEVDIRALRDTRVTNKTNFKPVRATLEEWDENGHRLGKSGKVKVAVAENVHTFQHGLMRITLKDGDKRLSALMHIDSMLQIAMHAWGAVEMSNRKDKITK